MMSLPSVDDAAAPPEQAAIVRRVRRLSDLLDNAIAVPGFGGRLRFGLDPIIGLVPGAGDLVTAALAAYIVVEAHRLGVPRRTLLRMIANVAIDFLGGSVPLLGDVFDFAFKCNARNVRLLEEALGAKVGEL